MLCYCRFQNHTVNMASAKPISVASNPKINMHYQKIGNTTSCLLRGPKVIETVSTSSKGGENSLKI